MAAGLIEDVQKGWKVYAGSEELGRVEEVGDDELVVGRGRLVHHTYRVPAAYVDDVTPGIVDLKVDRATIESVQSEY